MHVKNEISQAVLLIKRDGVNVSARGGGPKQLRPAASQRIYGHFMGSVQGPGPPLSTYASVEGVAYYEECTQSAVTE